MQKIYQTALESAEIPPMDTVTDEVVLPENYLLEKDANSEKKIISTNVEISSMDRYFSCKPSITDNNFKFSVSLLRNGDDWRKYPNHPIYSNSPWHSYYQSNYNVGIASSDTWPEGTYGQINTDTFIDSSDFGTIETWDAIKVSKTFNMPTINDLNRIKTLSIKSVLIYQNINGTKTFPNVLKYPYIVLHISEINSVYSSTNETLSRAAAKLVFDKNSQATEDHASHLLYKTYKPEIIPMSNFTNSSLSRLSFQLLTPNGNQISTLKDIFLVKSIVPCTSDGKTTDADIVNDGHLKITFAEYVETTQLQGSHNVIFENIVLIPSIFQNLGGASFLEFLHSSAGHSITSIGTETEDGYINSIVIELDKTVDYTTGAASYTQYEDEAFWTGMKTYNIPTGYMVNTTIQTSISLGLEIERD